MLDVVRRELQAADARIEVGGEPTDAPDLIWVQLATGVRLVARFSPPPADRDDATRRLGAVSEAFAQTVHESVEAVTSDVAVRRPAVRRNLTDALAVLTEGAHAVLCVVIDERSPVIWGRSDASLTLEDVEEALALAQDHAVAKAAGIDPGTPAPATLETAEDRALVRSVARLRARWSDNPAAARRDLLAARALTWAREEAESDDHRMESELGVLVRRFAGIYRLVLVFDGPYSELVADPITRRALPVIERLVSELPPLDPTPEGARVVPIRPK